MWKKRPRVATCGLPEEKWPFPHTGSENGHREGGEILISWVWSHNPFLRQLGIIFLHSKKSLVQSYSHEPARKTWVPLGKSCWKSDAPPVPPPGPFPVSQTIPASWIIPTQASSQPHSLQHPSSSSHSRELPGTVLSLRKNLKREWEGNLHMLRRLFPTGEGQIFGQRLAKNVQPRTEQTRSASTRARKYPWV